MADPKFLTLYRTLAREEAADFRKYLKRMYGNDTLALEVYDFIRKQKMDKRPGVDYICEKLYGTTSPTARKNLQNGLSDLFLWLKDFLLTDKATDGKFDSRFLWLKVTRDHRLEDEFCRQAQSLQNDMENLPGQGLEDYLKIISLHHLVLYHRPADKPLPDENKLLRFKNDLDVFYALAQLKVACELANLKNQMPPGTVQELLSQPDFGAFKISGLDKHPLLRLYWEVYQMIASQREESYAGVIALLSKHASHIDPSELHALFSYLHNYAALQIRNGKAAYWKSTHLLNCFGADHAVFTRDGGLSATQFNNIIAVACRVEAFQWAERFVASHGSYLPDAVQEETALLAKAIILFEQKKFKKVLQTLSDRDFKNTLDEIRSRALILRSLYELGEDENDMLDYCLAFEKYMRRGGQSGLAAVRGTLNSVRVVKMLIRKKAPREQILKTIHDTRPIYFDSWLEEKAKRYARASG